MASDLVSLILQAVGGAITSIADADQADLAQAGINVMIAGLASQVVSLTLFIVFCMDFAWAVKKNPNNLNEKMQNLREQFKWKAFLVGEFSFPFSFPFSVCLRRCGRC